MQRQRNIGLDIARVMAIVLVWVGHSGVFSLGLDPRFMEYWGIVCLEIFFVLSGFLVGSSMLRAVTAPVPGEPLKRFYVNRLFRTLPLYYLLLLTMWAVTKQAPSVLCFLFLQNSSEQALEYFPPSWSLPIEAWFYFLIPPLLLLLYRFFSRKHSQEKAVYCAIAVLYIVPLVLRIAHVLLNDPAWDFGVRKQVLLRMDSPMIGVLMAAVKQYRPEKYRRMGKSILSALVSVLGFAALYGWYLADLRENFDDSNMGRIFLFTLLPALSCLLVAYLENAAWPEKLRGRLPGKIISGISTLGYSIYLVHFGVFMVMSEYFIGARFIVSWMGFAGAVTVSLVLSFLTYRFIEEPITRVKDRVLAKI